MVCRSGVLSVLVLALLIGSGLLSAHALRAQEPIPTPAVPAAETAGVPLPINLPTALQLAGVRPVDVSIASERIRTATAQLDRANLLWLPTLYLGVDYARQDGQIQDVAGNVIPASRGSFMVGAGPSMTFAVTDAIYAPLAARQVLKAREADAQAVQNDTMCLVAESYFNVQMSRGELAGAVDAVKRIEDVVRRAEQLAQGLTPAVEANRARSELSRRRQAVETAYERWQTASVDLTRRLRLSPAAIVEPAEPPQTRVEMVDMTAPVDDLIPIALTTRPELRGQQALVQATLARLKQEKMRPLVPSILLRGNATNPTGTFTTGVFGGGVNDQLRDFNYRNSADLQVVWELQNLGFGNRALVRERESESQIAVLEMMRVQDRVAAEVVQAYAQARRAANRVQEAEAGVREAADTADKNIANMGQTRRVGEVLVLVFRTQEVVASVQALAQAYDDYYRAVADSNRAQFRLYRALGHPAECARPIAPVAAEAAAPTSAPRATLGFAELPASPDRPR